MTPDYAVKVEPPIRHVLAVLDRKSHRAPVDVHGERGRISRLLEDVQQAASAGGPAAAEFDLALRCLVYWVDEVYSEAFGADWQAERLEDRFFGTDERAWRFYTDFERRSGAAGPDVVETWYLATVLGFRGDIRTAFETHLGRPMPGTAGIGRGQNGGEGDPDDARRTWVKELERQVRQSPPDPLDAPDLTGTVRPLHGRTLLRGAAGLTGVAAVAFAALLAVFLLG